MAQRYKFSIESKRLPPSLSGDPEKVLKVLGLNPNGITGKKESQVLALLFAYRMVWGSADLYVDI